METATKPQVQPTEAIPDTDIFSAESEDRQIPEAAESFPRLLVRMAARVESLASNFGENMADRRTASEVVSDASDSVSKKGQEVYVFGRKVLGNMGRAATRNLVRVVTAPAKAGEALAQGMENGLNKIEARAQSAQQRKMDRITARKSAKSLKLQEKQDLKVAKQARKDIKAEAKLTAETEKNQAKADKQHHKARLKQHRKNMREARQMERDDARREQAERNREAARERAAAAAARKAARQAKYQERLRNAKEAIGKRAKQAKRVGGAAVQGVVSFGSGVALMGKEAAREAKEIGTEIVTSAKNKASESLDKSRVNRGHKAAQKAENLLNKTKASKKPNSSYKVPVMYEDGRS